MRCALYLRMSLDSGQGLGIARQRKACRALAKAKGWAVAAEFEETVSAAGKAGRPQWEELLRRCAAGEFDAVVAWAVDRFTRNTRDLLRLMSISKETGLRIAVVQGGDIDMSTPQGRLVAGILGLVAQGEIEHKGERQRIANAQRRERGEPPSGVQPRGWASEEEGALIRGGFELLLKGASLRRIGREWTEAGLRTAKGREWRYYAVRGVLMNPRYMGMQKDGVTPGNWPALVDADTFEAVQAILTDPSRRNTPSTRRKYLLSGLALCGVCGAKVNTGGTAAPARTRTYKCSQAKHMARAAQPVDDLVELTVIERLSRPDAAELLAEDDADARQARAGARKLRTRLESLAVDFAEGELTAAQLRAATGRLRLRLAEAEAAVARLGRASLVAPLLGRVEEAWAGLAVEERRAVVDVLAEITLLPPGQGARVFNPDTVRIAWRSE